MANPPADIAALRTLALVGPATAGKTTLVEALLWKAGVLGAPGSVERGSTVSDFDPLERRAQRSLNASLIHFRHGDVHAHVIDTPGAPDFLGQSLPALEAVETAAVVISATTGIEPMAVRMMQWAAQRERDRLIIVNKIDAQGVNLQALVAQIQAEFGRECLPLNLPAERGARVVDCFFNMAPDSPATDFSSVGEAHRALVEQVVEVDAAFVERYLNDGDVDPQQLHAPLEQALREGHLIPICFVSARTGAGVPELLDVIARLLPDPSEGNPPQFLHGEGAEAQPLRAEPDAKPPRAGPRVQDHAGPIRRQDGGAARAPGHARRGQPALRRRRAPAVQGRPSVHAAGQGLHRDARAPCRATCAPSPRWRSCTSTRCCTTRRRTTTSTSSRSIFRCRCTAWRSSPSAAATSSACTTSCKSW